MAKMKAAFFDGKNAMDIAEVERPQPTPGDVVIRVHATGICGSDLLMNVDKTEPDAIPFGHEVSGEIVEVGAGVDRSLVGQASRSRRSGKDSPAPNAGTVAKDNIHIAKIIPQEEAVALPSLFVERQQAAINYRTR